VKTVDNEMFSNGDFFGYPRNFKRLKKYSASYNNSKSTSAVNAGEHYHKSLQNFMAQSLS